MRCRVRNPPVSRLSANGTPDRSKGEAAVANLDTQFAGSIPEIYNRHLGPIIFQPYADDLAQRAKRLNARSVLETAAGTGIVTRALLAALPDHSSVTATDLNQAMVDYAARNTQTSGRVRFQQADACALPFGDDSSDMVVCQFGVMFFPDKVAAHREALRVLKPGGMLLFNVWGPIDRNDFANVITEAVAALFPSDPPRFFARTPHGYHDAATIERELRSAAFANVKIERVDRESVAPSAKDCATAFCQGTPLRNEIEARDPARLNEATDAAATALARQFGSGRISGRMQALVIEARKP
jgi:ubiquinone/menaquinone biosynthesis C-methylase UbiE